MRRIQHRASLCRGNLRLKHGSWHFRTGVSSILSSVRNRGCHGWSDRRAGWETTANSTGTAPQDIISIRASAGLGSAGSFFAMQQAVRGHRTVTVADSQQQRWLDTLRCNLTVQRAGCPLLPALLDSVHGLSTAAGLIGRGWPLPLRSGTGCVNESSPMGNLAHKAYRPGSAD